MTKKIIITYFNSEIIVFSQTTPIPSVTTPVIDSWLPTHCAQHNTVSHYKYILLSFLSYTLVNYAGHSDLIVGTIWSEARSVHWQEDTQPSFP